MPAFFDRDLFQFFRELKENNNKTWFEANKDRYEQRVRDPALAFIAAFAAPLSGISPHFQAIAKGTGGSMFRIHRDTRFSADKTPYPTALGLHFRHESAKDAHAPGFYLHLESGECGAGIGLWMPDNPTLARLRGAIVGQSDRWAALKADVAAQGYEFMGREEGLKKVPRGFDPDHAHAEDLKLKSFAVWKPFSDDTALADDFLDRYVAVCRGAAPVAAFLCEALDLPC